MNRIARPIECVGGGPLDGDRIPEVVAMVEFLVPIPPPPPPARPPEETLPETTVLHAHRYRLYDCGHYHYEGVR